MKKSIDTYFDITDNNKKLLEQTNLVRYSIKDDSLALETLSARAYIEKGISQLKFSLSDSLLLNLERTEIDNSERVIVEAEWYSDIEADQKGIVRTSSKDANIFDGMGVILVSDNIKIPKVVANEDNVKFYNLTLIKDGASFPMSPFMADTLLMEYEYKSNYEDDFLIQENGGGGYYVEKHNFPHIHIPINEDSKGHIIIGKKISSKLYCFTAFKIPYGYALLTPIDVIHGDGTLKGKYAISVAGFNTKSDTVLFFNKKTLTKLDQLI